MMAVACETSAEPGADRAGQPTATVAPTDTPTIPPVLQARGEGGEPEREADEPSSEPAGDQPTAQPTSDTEAPGGAAATPAPGAEPPPAVRAPTDSGSVSVDILLDRSAGTGTCGSAPWAPEPCSDIGPTIWWGLHLEASLVTDVVLVAAEDGRWIITNDPEYVRAAGYDPEIFEDGNFRDAQIDMSPSPGCSGTIEGHPFATDIFGMYDAGQIQLTLAPDVHETIDGACGGTPFMFDTTWLLFGLGVATTGDPSFVEVTLTEDDRGTAAGSYTKEYDARTNPSPDDRDHVVVAVELTCEAPIPDGGFVSVPCPWE